MSCLLAGGCSQTDGQREMHPDIDLLQHHFPTDSHGSDLPESGRLTCSPVACSLVVSWLAFKSFALDSRQRNISFSTSLPDLTNVVISVPVVVLARAMATVWG